MTVPLRYINRGRTIGFDLQQFSQEELALLRYNLRVRYANQLNGNGAGAVLINGGTNFGSAQDSDRTQVTNSHPSFFPGASTGRQTVNYSYGHNLTGISAVPTDFTNSYASFSGNTTAGEILQERNINNILNSIITPCVNEMRTGDEVGTYRVAASSPGTGWTNRGTFFQDTRFNNQVITTYSLWLRTSATAPTDNGFLPIRVDSGSTTIATFQQLSLASNSAFETFLFNILVSRLNNNQLRYSIGNTGIARGTFINTELAGTSNSNQFINANDYRSTATPSGGVTTRNTYTLRLI